MKARTAVPFAVAVVVSATVGGTAVAAQGTHHHRLSQSQSASQSSSTRHPSPVPGEPSDSGSLAGAVALLAGGAPISPSATLPDEASTVSPTPEPSDLAGQARDAIKEAINDGKLSQVEGDLALLFLDGKMRPDPALQDAWRSIVGTAASFLGISAQVLQTDLSSGQSLAQIAQAQRRSLAGLQDTIYSQCKATLDRAVADGAMTTSAENDLLALVQAHLVAAVGSHI